MKSQLTILFLAIALAVSAQTKSVKKSPPLSEAAPETVGMSAERLARIGIAKPEEMSYLVQTYKKLYG